MERRAFMAAASAAALALPAVVRAQSRRVLKFIPQTDLAVLDPVWTATYVTRNHGYLVFDTLYGQSGPEGGYSASPQMVAGHSVDDDGRTWTLTLRDGLLFHDGERVLARDCVASIRRWGTRDALGQELMRRTDALTAPDDQTIQFRLKRPFSLLPDALGKCASNMCAIMPERLANTDPFKQVTEMVGSGPFRFKADERVPGSRVVYERFTQYEPREGGKPEWTAGPKIAHFDRIEWHVIPDPATAAAALQAGEVDGWEQPPADLLPSLARNGRVARKLVNSTGFCELMRPNHLVPPFDNPGVRRALLGAIDQAGFMTAAMGSDPSLWTVPCGFFPPASPMASDAGMSALSGPRDLAGVKRDLEAAGYKGEKVALMVAVEYSTLKAISDVAADLLKRVGINVDYQAMDGGTLIQRRTSQKPVEQGGWSLYCVGNAGSDFATPATHLQLRGNGPQAPPGWPTSPGIEALRDTWFDAPDLDAQKRIAADIQTQAFRDVPYYPLGLVYIPSAYRADLDGILDGFPIFWSVRQA